MTSKHGIRHLHIGPVAVCLVVAGLLWAASPARADLAELRAREAKIQAVAKKAVPATVAVQAGMGMGSGVIVSPDGIVLTASHVSGDPDQEITLLLSDGRVVKGKALGANRSVDAGMIQITEKGPWPYVSVGKSADMKLGDWCVGTGHPGGVHVGRSAPVRVGRIVHKNFATLMSDCALIGGDSGGPLFDLQGRVVGIHSSIGTSLAENRHVPIDRYQESWDRMLKGEAWGSLLSAARFHGPRGIDEGGFLGVQLEAGDDGITVLEVVPGSPAAKAGIQPDDVIVEFNGKPVEGLREFVMGVARKKPGTKVTIEVRRGDATKRIHVALGRRGD